MFQNPKILSILFLLAQLTYHLSALQSQKRYATTVSATHEGYLQNPVYCAYKQPDTWSYKLPPNLTQVCQSKFQYWQPSFNLLGEKRYFSFRKEKKIGILECHLVLILNSFKYAVYKAVIPQCLNAKDAVYLVFL